ncbi:hypothetical protein Pint_04598 [Pistacia integerrima]|uniref:Uncharacterized protein n=1 Tax=Pistacia integerrima TaxID=434235 RepID=A0ACC0Z9I0_9ROSI|nr:hypothetical protein Pint_04598 [Pistacia integerrima]
MFASHLGKLELARATLANSWAVVTGFAFMTGLNGALETLCGQGFGARLYKIVGIYLQAYCIISFFFSIILSVVWIYTEPILILLHQDPDISKQAALYMKYLIPGLFAYGILRSILRFLQTQSIVLPLVLISVLPVGTCFGVAYALVHRTSLGFKGAALAALKTGPAFCRDGLSNELGADYSNRAKNAMAVTLELSVILALLVGLALVFGHDIWDKLFTDSPEIIKKISSFTPFLAISISLDSVQGVLSGFVDWVDLRALQPSLILIDYIVQKLE